MNQHSTSMWETLCAGESTGQYGIPTRTYLPLKHSPLFPRVLTQEEEERIQKIENEQLQRRQLEHSKRLNTMENYEKQMLQTFVEEYPDRMESIENYKKTTQLDINQLYAQQLFRMKRQTQFSKAGALRTRYSEMDKKLIDMWMKYDKLNEHFMDLWEMYIHSDSMLLEYKKKVDKDTEESRKEQQELEEKVKETITHLFVYENQRLGLKIPKRPKTNHKHTQTETMEETMEQTMEQTVEYLEETMAETEEETEEEIEEETVEETEEEIVEHSMEQMVEETETVKQTETVEHSMEDLMTDSFVENEPIVEEPIHEEPIVKEPILTRYYLTLNEASSEDGPATPFQNSRKRKINNNNNNNNNNKKIKVEPLFKKKRSNLDDGVENMDETLLDQMGIMKIDKHQAEQLKILKPFETLEKRSNKQMYLISNVPTDSPFFRNGEDIFDYNFRMNIGQKYVKIKFSKDDRGPFVYHKLLTFHSLSRLYPLLVEEAQKPQKIIFNLFE